MLIQFDGINKNWMNFDKLAFIYGEKRKNIISGFSADNLQKFFINEISIY